MQLWGWLITSLSLNRWLLRPRRDFLRGVVIWPNAESTSYLKRMKVSLAQPMRSILLPFIRAQSILSTNRLELLHFFIGLLMIIYEMVSLGKMIMFTKNGNINFQLLSSKACRKYIPTKRSILRPMPWLSSEAFAAISCKEKLEIFMWQRNLFPHQPMKPKPANLHQMLKLVLFSRSNV